MRRHSFSLTPELLNLTAVLIMMVFHNSTMFSRAEEISANTSLYAAFILMAFSANLALVTLLTLLFVPIIQRFVLAILLSVSSITSYFTDTVGAVYDPDLVSAVLDTNLRETAWLLSADLVVHIFLWGLAPAVLLLVIPIKRRGRIKNAVAWALLVFLAYSLSLVVRNLGESEFKQLSRRERDAVTFSLQPGAFLAAAAQVAGQKLQTLGQPFTPIGVDAQAGPILQASSKPIVLFLVVGESARAENHGFNGYERPTTPLLDQLEIINFGRATACATSTRPSIRCMFSKFSKGDFTYAKFATHENLTDIINRAGLDVRWFNNNWSPTGVGVATRQNVETLYDDLSHPACSGKECVDSVFFEAVDRVLAETNNHMLVVLHLAGSHFPFSDRYPAEFKVFEPACERPVFTECTQEEIINSYDNSILYNDYILSTIIQKLKAQDKVLPALIYVSDHGESLGENGVYAHSHPVETAPPEQLSIPFFLWLSKGYSLEFDADPTCLASKAGSVSHDNVFHTVLGLLDVRTLERKPELDLSDGCVKTPTRKSDNSSTSAPGQRWIKDMGE